MQKPDLPTIIVGALLALVVATGVYVTYVRQPAELDRLEKAEKAAKMKQAEMQELLTEYSQSQAQARKVTSKWRSRYKVVPDSLTTPEVVGYLNSMTRDGFETFDISMQGVQEGDAYNHYTLRATGRGYFSSLYQFIWQVENSRKFYAVEDLNLNHIDLITEVGSERANARDPSEEGEKKRKKLQVMVSFNMSINAYFGGPEGVAASGSEWRPAGEDGKPQARSASLPPVPSKVLADADPNINPFFPVIMEQVPPNSRGLLDLDQSKLVSIVGGKAVFKGPDGEMEKLGVGDDVYLGQITEIDPARGRVRAVLNRGGIIDDVEKTLGIEDAYQGVTGTAPMPAPQDASDSAARGTQRVGGSTARQRENQARQMGSNSQGQTSQGGSSQVNPSGQRRSAEERKKARQQRIRRRQAQQQRARKQQGGDGQ